jgi:hypothetical protein
VEQAQKPGFYRAPMFSWASVDGEIDWDVGLMDDSTSYVHLEDWHVELSGPDPFGCVSGGWIKITALIGSGVIRDGQLRCAKTDTVLGYAAFDHEWTSGATEGWEVEFVPLYTTIEKPRWTRIMLVRRRDDATQEFERVGRSVSWGLDVEFLDEAWYSTHYVRTSLTIF